MVGAREEILSAGLFHKLSGIHQTHTVRHLSNYRQIMRDQQNANVFRIAKALNEIKNLRLNGHIKRGRRLVRD